MLTADDIPTIRFAIRRRLEQETGVEIIEILAEPHAGPPAHLKVAVHLRVGWLLRLAAIFDLPDPFEHSHLVNEIDQIAEQIKAARRDFFRNGMRPPPSEGIKLKGTGTRGLWAQYGLRDG